MLGQSMVNEVASMRTSSASITYKRLFKLKPNGTIADPAVRGLRYRCVASSSGKFAVYAQFRYKLHNGWRSVELGRLPTEDEITSLADARLESIDLTKAVLPERALTSMTHSNPFGKARELISVSCVRGWTRRESGVSRASHSDKPWLGTSNGCETKASQKVR
jgi:hypothetical protein